MKNTTKLPINFALLQQVIYNPHDMVIRMAYHDWLEENYGEHDRDRLLYVPDILKNNPHINFDFNKKYGFIDAIRLTVDEWENSLYDIFLYHPISDVRIWNDLGYYRNHHLINVGKFETSKYFKNEREAFFYLEDCITYHGESFRREIYCNQDEKLIKFM